MRAHNKNKNTYFWENFSKNELLKIRLCDLQLKIEGSEIEPLIKDLHRELSLKKISYKPHVWISDEWFVPDEIGGIAIPFYVVHPKLLELEQSQISEVEGETIDACMKLLRHECGHAIDNAYRLRQLKERQSLFGDSDEKYLPYYSPRPYSKKFIKHLDYWYAQSHPDEDFAETFALWLTPKSAWRQKYKNWAAIKKLNYINKVMKGLQNASAINSKRTKVDELRNDKRTLKEYYFEKRKYLGLNKLGKYDRDLLHIFTRDANMKRNKVMAAPFIRSIKNDALKIVSKNTGIYRYIIKQVVDDLAHRSESLNLLLTSPKRETKSCFIEMLEKKSISHVKYKKHLVLR